MRPGRPVLPIRLNGSRSHDRTESGRRCGWGRRVSDDQRLLHFRAVCRTSPDGHIKIAIRGLTWVELRRLELLTPCLQVH
jgi:hypothetical protein